MTHGSLFSGIGGFDLAAEWMGWQNVFHCEIDPFCRKILKHYWPNAITHEDIDTTDFNIWRNRIDVLSGGFPCQPFSMSGHQAGSKDARNKWPAMYRTICQVQPNWIVIENVRHLLNIERGLVFEQIQIDLAFAKYEAASFIIPACGVNAPHRRERIFIVARRSVANTVIQGREEICDDIQPEFANGKIINGDFDKDFWKERTAKSAFCGAHDGISRAMDGIPFHEWRSKSIEAYGNAIVPKIAFEIFKTIQQCETFNHQ